MSRIEFDKMCVTCEYELINPERHCGGCQETPEHPHWRERTNLRRAIHVIEDAPTNAPTDIEARLAAAEAKISALLRGDDGGHDVLSRLEITRRLRAMQDEMAEIICQSRDSELPSDDLAKAIISLLAAPKEWLPQITALIKTFDNVVSIKVKALPGGQVQCTFMMRGK